MSDLPLRRVEPRPDEVTDTDTWFKDVPAVAQLLEHGMRFGSATVLVGENGTGKSTLVEAIAMAFGLGAEGGTRNTMHATYRSESDLHRHIRCARGAGASRWGFFLRAETMHGYFTYQSSVGALGPDYHAMSHGESFRELLLGPTFQGPGLFVLDEPESALSFSAQLMLLTKLMELTEEGSQVILSTHSPVLAALPGARLLELGAWGWRETTWQELELVDHYRRFMESPERYLRHLR